MFGIYGRHDAAALTALGLHALQHRGQEAAGIVSFDGRQFHTHRALGQVADGFGSETVIARLPGSTAVGHVRYSTTGDTVLRNVQPLFAEFAFGGLAIGHNGNLTNAYELRHRLVKTGCLFQSTTDTEVIVHLIATSPASTVIDRMVDALAQVEGAYSLVALTADALIGVRDPFGVRPLVLGKQDDAYILASETCALDIIGADYVRDIEPGEVLVIDANGLTSHHPFRKAPHRFCIFEFIYFARPDSVVEGTSVYEARKRIGAELARESDIAADIVIPVPDSGGPAAIGSAAEAGIPFELGIIRNHYVGRTFIEPGEQIRHLGVKLKHNANRAYIAGKRVILVDDSIVRGTTSKKIVEMVRAAAHAKCTCGSPARPRCIPASTASTRRNARSCSPPITTSRRWRNCSASTAWRSYRSTGFIAPWAGRGAIRKIRSFATPVFPGTTRSRSPTATVARSRRSCHCWPNSPDPCPGSLTGASRS